METFAPRGQLAAWVVHTDTNSELARLELGGPMRLHAGLLGFESEGRKVESKSRSYWETD